MTVSLDRRGLMLALTAGLPLGVAGCQTPMASTPMGLRLVSLPDRVFKITDLPREGTEAWFVSVAVESDAQIALAPLGLEVLYFSGGAEVARRTYGADAAQAIAIANPPLGASAGPRTAPVSWPLAFRIASRERAALNIDRMRVSVRARSEQHGDIDLVSEIAIATYTQRIDLIFPFRGAGIVTQGGAANAGHRNRSGQFAIDAMGMSANYAVQVSERFEQNTDLVGYGRDLVAPAAGTIVSARGDRPDQPVPGESNEDYHLPEFRGAGDPGNHVVIDHGNGEFTLVAHLMAGSLSVAAGDHVAQGERLGRLGNSGDSFAPHVHVQLMDGPRWEYANALPCRFSNVSSQSLTRGEFFLAR